jgi:hypothetical protein
VTAYAAAQPKAHYLNTVDGWVAKTGYLSGLGGNNLEAVIRILRPASMARDPSA